MASSSVRLKLVAVAGAAALVLAACGSDDNGASDTSAPATSDSAPAETSAPEESTPEESSAPEESTPEESTPEESTPEESTDAPADADCSTATFPTVEGDLVIGSLLPQTGNLAFLGPPEIAGVDLAINEINACGAFGGDVTLIHTDSGDDKTNIASQSVDGLIQQNASAIVGAAASGVSKLVIDKITGAGILQISPANTSPDFTTWDDNGLYFRTAPSDILQGAVLADQVLADGYTNVAVIALDDAYGNGLKAQIIESVTAAGGTIVLEKTYDPAAASFSSEVTEIAGSGADALVIVGFDETIKIINALVDQGVGPQDLPLYLVDGNLKNFGDEFPAGTLAGSKGTLPGGETAAEFQEALLAVDPALEDFSYAGESYDATVLVALAALSAGSADGAAIAAEMANVSSEGTKCTSFTECAVLLANGEDIDYDGISGPISFDENGDITEASIGIYEYGDDNNYTNIEFVFGQI